MKRGLNNSDVNILRMGLRNGWSIEEITAKTHTSPGVVQKYIDSMDPDLVEKLRSEAPASGVDVDALKYEIKQELMEEMRAGITSDAEPDYEDITEAELEAATAPNEEDAA